MATHYNSRTVPGSRLLFDQSNPRSYTSGNDWKDMIRNTTYTQSGTSTSIGDEAWMNGDGITIVAVIDKIGDFVGYAENPVRKITTTTDASFTLYHFGNGSNTFRWYANGGGVWKSISAGYVATIGETYVICLTYNDTDGGYLWINGAKVGARTGGGALASTTSQMLIFGPDGSTTAKVQYCQMWDREITDVEMSHMYKLLNQRFGV